MLVIPCRGRKSATYTKAISADIHTHTRARAHTHAHTGSRTQTPKLSSHDFPQSPSQAAEGAEREGAYAAGAGWGWGGSPVSFDGLNPLRMAEEANETSENFAPAATLQACLARRGQRGGTMGERWPWVSVTAAAPRSRGPGRMRPGPSAWTQRGLFSGLELRGGGRSGRAGGLSLLRRECPPGPRRTLRHRHRPPQAGSCHPRSQKEFRLNRTEAALLWDPSLDETWDSEVKPEGVKTLGTDQMRWMFFACEKDIHLGRGAEGRVWVEIRPVAFVPEAPVASTPHPCG